MSSSDAANLSSASSILDDLIDRVCDVAERYSGGDQESVAFGLHEVERSLRAAARQLDAVQRTLT